MLLTLQQTMRVPSVQLSVGDLVQLGEQQIDGPSWIYASLPLVYPWVNAGGDYLDASGAANGSTHYATSVYPPNFGPWDVTVIVRKMLASGNTGFYLNCDFQNGPGFADRTSGTPPTLQVITTAGTVNPQCVECCWIASSSSQTLGGPYIRFPALLKFDLRNITGTVISATLSVTLNNAPSPQNYTVTVDYLKMPVLIHDPTRQIGGVVQGIAAAGEFALATHSSVIFYPANDSHAAIRSDWQPGPFAGGQAMDVNYENPAGTIDPAITCNVPTFLPSGDWIAYGLAGLRMSSVPDVLERILTWKHNIVAGKKELYLRYLLKINPDVYLYMTEIGVKLPGFEGSGFSARMEHGRQSVANPNTSRFKFYIYDAQYPFNDPNRGGTPVTDTCMDGGRLYCIEQRIKQNTIGNTVVGSGLDGPIYNTTADGALEIWVDGVKVYSQTNIVVNNTIPTGDVNLLFANVYHGGNGLGPTAPIHYELGGVCVASEYIGPPKALVAPTITLGISSTWPGWPNTTRFNMEYSNAHQHSTNGRQLEFAFAQHSRPPADHTSVRWTDFASTGAPTQDYYWVENDDRIYESDNYPSFYMPWKQWVALWNVKVIDIATPAAVLRWPSAAACTAAFNAATPLDMTPVFDVILSGAALASYVNSNYNPACLVNPDGNFTCSFGGGYFFNYLSGNPPAMHLIDDNPNYPATSTKPLRLRCWTYTGASPNVSRHCVKIGNWIYWGGSGVSDDFTRGKEFYRIYVPDLINSQIVTQERLADCPLTVPFGYADTLGTRFPLLAADVPRKRLIFINLEGVYVYQLYPSENGGVWLGPYNVPNWPTLISDGDYDGSTISWKGVIGTHRSDLNQTFFRYNNSKKWNRIAWNF